MLKHAHETSRRGISLQGNRRWPMTSLTSHHPPPKKKLSPPPGLRAQNDPRGSFRGREIIWSAQVNLLRAICGASKRGRSFVGVINQWGGVVLLLFVMTGWLLNEVEVKARENIANLRKCKRMSQKVRALVPTIQCACPNNSERLSQQVRALVPPIFVGTTTYICWDNRLYLLGQALILLWQPLIFLGC